MVSQASFFAHGALGRRVSHTNVCATWRSLGWVMGADWDPWLAVRSARVDEECGAG
jgi:hypothetical protein